MNLEEIHNQNDLSQFLTERNFVSSGIKKYKIDKTHYLEVKILQNLSSEDILLEYKEFKNKYQDTHYQLLIDPDFSKFVFQRDNGRPNRVSYNRNKQYDPNTEINFLRRIDSLQYENTDFNNELIALFETRISITEKGAINFLAECMNTIQREITDLSTEDYTQLEEVTGFLWARKLDEKAYENPEESQRLQYDAKSAASYIIVNQFLFYHLLQYHQPDKFPRLLQPDEDTTDPAVFNNYFNEVRQASTEGDYMAVFGADLLSILPKSKKVVNAINSTISMIMDSDIEQVNGDVLGKIFHSMIPAEIRRRIAAYYTGNAPAQLLARLAIKKPEAIVMDLTCGSGTLLVESYHVKDELYREKNQKMTDGDRHTKILKELFGNDISVFAAHLASINLARQNLDVFTDAVNITIGDGLAITPEEKISRMIKILKKSGANLQMDQFLNNNAKKASKKYQKRSLDGEDQWITYPYADCILMNPPFSRRMNMDEETVNHMDKLMQSYNLGEFIDRKMGLHGYFILHVDQFLRDGGVMAMVLPTSTFTTDYTRTLMQFLQTRKYSIDYVFETLSKRSAFSEDCFFKEYMILLRKNMLIADEAQAKTLLVTFKDEFNVEEVKQSASDIEQRKPNQNIIYKEILTKDLYQSQKWTELFTESSASLDKLYSNPKIEKYSENISGIQLSIGFNGTNVDFLMIPNKDWDIKDLGNDQFQLKNHKDQISCVISGSYLVPAVRKSETANSLKTKPNSYILNLPYELPPELQELQDVYLHPAENFIEKKHQHAADNGRRRAVLIREPTYKTNQKGQRTIDEKPWYSHAFTNKCNEKRTHLFVLRPKYRPKIRHSIVIYSEEFVSSSDVFYHLRTPNDEFYASWTTSVLYIISHFQNQQIQSKGLMKIEAKDYSNVRFPKYELFDEVTRNKLIDLWKQFADLPEEQVPALSQQLGIKENEKITINPLSERFNLDKGWLLALDVPENEIDITINELYTWLINYIDLN